MENIIQLEIPHIPCSGYLPFGSLKRESGTLQEKHGVYFNNNGGRKIVFY